MSQATGPIPVTLHLGAHGAGLSAVQDLIDREARAAGSDLSAWLPERTRTGLLDGLLGDPANDDGFAQGRRVARASGRIAMRRDALASRGIRRLVVSEPALMGGLREMILLARLYPAAWARLRRLRGVMPEVDRVCLTLRDPAGLWGDALDAMARRGLPGADGAAVAAMARSRRGWREVIADVADALPRARILVWTHEEFGRDPAAAAALITGRAMGKHAATSSELRLAGQRPVTPFDPDQRAALAAAYADDLTWLRGGADGLAHFVTGRPDGPPPADEEGKSHDRSDERQGEMGRAGSR